MSEEASGVALGHSRTTPSPLPTTTSAVKRIRLPPLVTCGGGFCQCYTSRRSEYACAAIVEGAGRAFTVRFTSTTCISIVRSGSSATSLATPRPLRSWRSRNL